MNKFRLSERVIVACLVCLAIMCACSSSLEQSDVENTTPPYSEVQKLHTFTKNFVEVDIVLEQDTFGNLIIASTYTPTKTDLHLYSIDLPINGINGAGRPTRLELIQEDKLRAVGPLFADQPVIEDHVEGFAEPFLIYPDGPVTLRLPVALQNHDKNSIQTHVSVTFMACSSKGRCLPPVVDKQIRINISSGNLSQQH